MGTVKRKRVSAENGRMGSLYAMLAKYPDERSCERRIIEAGWPEGWVCPKCEGRGCSPAADRNRTWQCTRCSRQFSVTAGTYMQHSRVGLRRWFHAMWHVARSKRGVSAMELAAQIGRLGGRGGLHPRGAEGLNGEVRVSSAFSRARWSLTTSCSPRRTGARRGGPGAAPTSGP